MSEEAPETEEETQEPEEVPEETPGESEVVVPEPDEAPISNESVSSAKTPTTPTTPTIPATPPSTPITASPAPAPARAPAPAPAVYNDPSLETPVVAVSTARLLLSKSIKRPSDGHTVKIVIIGAGHIGVAIAYEILIKRMAAVLVIIDVDDEIAKAEAEDLSHAAVVLGDAEIIGTMELCNARDATLIVLAGCYHMAGMEGSLVNMKRILPEVCRYAPSSVLVVVESPVDVLSYAAMKLSGFHSGRVIGVGTILDSCRMRHLVAEKLGIAGSAVQAPVIGESGKNSVPIWSAVSVMGMKLKDINKDIGGSSDPECWCCAHHEAATTSKDLIRRKGHHCWAAAACTCKILDAVLRDACVCMTVSTFVKGCRHGLEKDVFMSLPCIVGRDGVLSYVRHLYTPEEQELTTQSSRSIYEAQKAILAKLG